MPIFILGSAIAGIVVVTTRLISVYNAAGTISQSDRGRRIKSRIVGAFAHEPDKPSEFTRTCFRQQQFFERKTQEDHSHGKSAALRSSASVFAESFARRCASTAFFRQMSRADQRQRRGGDRFYVWDKDLNARQTSGELTDERIETMIDVDYYIDMPAHLCDNFKPHLLYTLQPERVAAVEDEYCFTFDSSNRLTYKVTGGGTYSHEVWDYGVDCVTARKTFLGIPYHVATYIIERRSVAKDRSMVLLTPLRRWKWFGALFGCLLESAPLKRLQPVQGKFLRMDVLDKNGLNVSTGIPGQYNTSLLPKAHDEAISAMALAMKLNLSLPQVMAFSDESVPLASRRAAAAVLLAYHRHLTPHVTPRNAMSFPVPEGVRNYDYGVKSYDPDDKPMLTPYMAPFIHGAFSPLLTDANEKEMIRGRVTAIAHKSKLEKSEFMERTMNEFISFLVPDPHTLVPCELDEVWERQPRPTQRAQLEQSLWEDPNRKVRVFQKREAYGNVKSPRPIANINPVDKREYSRYIYPASELFKLTRWYAFAKSPSDIADKVVEVCEGAGSAVCSDFSRFDGRVSNLARDLERMFLVRAFRSEYAHDIAELHSSQFNQPAVGRFRNKYRSMWSRLSGSAETAAFNSMLCAFTTYYAFRTMRENGAFISPHEAWERLGVYGGDDGLTADIDPAAYTKAAINLGMVLDVDVIRQGKMGISFLSRMYGPEVWYGDANSTCDLPRQLAKFHTTTNMPDGVTPSDKLLEKVRSYYLTDKNTPVIGEFVSRSVARPGVVTVTEKTKLMRAWNSELDASLQYPNEDNGWMENYARNALGPFYFDFELFGEWLGDCKTLADYMSMPVLSMPPAVKAKRPVVVDEDVYEPEPLVETRVEPIPRGTRRQPQRRASTKKPKEPSKRDARRKKWSEDSKGRKDSARVKKKRVVKTSA
jgi:hypothetical protein